MVPHDAAVDLSSVPERAGSLLSLVTNWWVERCLYGKCLVNPADDVLSRPFNKHSINGESMDLADASWSGKADGGRVLRSYYQLDCICRHRTPPCDKGHRDHWYAINSTYLVSI